MNNDENKTPLVSIITIVFNGIDTLERTIKSIINHQYKNIEYIIIDGNSNDGTVELIKQYENHISKWISEPDKGLYDAMNKGMKLANGDYFWFINSGDEIASQDILATIFNNNDLADIYYGETLVIDQNSAIIGNRRLTPPENLCWKDFRKGMLVSHQSVIVSKNICGEYNTNYRFSSDFEWTLLSLKQAKSIRNTDLVLSKFLDGGLTKKNIIPGLKERFRIMRKYYGLVPTVFYHIPISVRFVLYYVRNKRF